MSVAQAIAAGESSRASTFPMGDISRLPSLGASAINTNLAAGTRHWTGGGGGGGYAQKSPDQIHKEAAELALKEREMDLREKQQDLDVLREHNRAAEEDQRLQEAARNGIETRYQNAMNNAQKRYAGDLAINQGEQADQAKQQDRDFQLAQYGAATHNAAPIIQYFNKYGTQGVGIDNIQWDPSGQDPSVLVNFSGQQKPVSFASTDDFMKKFMVLASPKVMGDIQKQAGAQAELGLKAREQARKEVETAAKIKRGGFTEPQIAGYRAKALAAYDKMYAYPMGGYKKDAPDKESYIKGYVNQITGGATGNQNQAIPGLGENKTTGTSPTQIQGQNAGQPDQNAPFSEFIDSKTGNKVRVYKNGLKLLLSPRGDIISKVTPKGSAQKVKNITENQVPQKKGLPKWAKKKARQYGSATFTDRNTGEKVKVTVDENGKLKRTVLGKKKDEQD